MNILKTQIAELQKLKTDTYGKDFLLTWEKTDAEIRALLLVAECLSELHRARKPFRVFETGLAVSIFRDKSTRTRFSFASAVNALGLGLSELDEEKSQIAHGETVRETANMISFLTEVIGIRDDMYLGEGNAYMREVGQAVREGFEKGVLHQRPSVINLQCDVDHPTQVLADLLHLKRHFGSLAALKGRKLAMTWAYSPSYGKPLSVPQGVIGLMTRFGMEVSLAYPEGYGLIPEVVDLARKNSAASGGKFKVVSSMDAAFKDADVVYPKSWAPYQVMQRRTPLLHQGDKEGLKQLETECLANNAKHKDWECDARKMKLTRKGEALYLHCLPADIKGVSCAQGEVAKDVFEKYRLATYREASFKPFIIAAMILLARFQGVPGMLKKLTAAASKP
ncbi:MAG TPA: knotted carbamoyltransferase YgeW [Verrucomicrobiota bacterium]|nr:knotted carbamoyltransferase YgeW [Verrucomicrobiota bacterium]HQL78303.1 knotted carbamoyltransferase YgeW [Verrucomicrobiota bacterium]